jgi:hypothetical protein
VSYRRERLPSNVFKMAYAINRNFHFDFTIMTLNIQYTVHTSTDLIDLNNI